ncbi:MAG: ATP-grasp domain-containing protein [Bacteroidota bacterium]
MLQKTVLVTGIGGNVGQGIIRNIRALKLPITIIGTNVEAFSAGNHLCDICYNVAYAYDETYIEEIVEIVKTNHIDLIIPSTDYEIYYLAKYIQEIPCKIAASHFDTTAIYLDKYLTALHHEKHNIPFATTVLPSQFKGEFKDFIVKPRKGRGSRGLHINPDTYDHFNDEEYLVQELHKGKEITTAFYVTQHNELLGSITFDRVLENGATTHCKVVDTYDARMNEILLQIIANGQIKGAANIQSIVDDSGAIHPFEINCRISGTNSIRANFGFEDVKYTLQELLFNEVPQKPVISKGMATRILMDVIYPDSNDFSEKINKSVTHYIY